MPTCSWMSAYFFLGSILVSFFMTLESSRSTAVGSFFISGPVIYAMSSWSTVRINNYQCYAYTDSWIEYWLISSSRTNETMLLFECTDVLIKNIDTMCSRLNIFFEILILIFGTLISDRFEKAEDEKRKFSTSLIEDDENVVLFRYECLIQRHQYLFDERIFVLLLPLYLNMSRVNRLSSSKSHKLLRSSDNLLTIIVDSGGVRWLGERVDELTKSVLDRISSEAITVDEDGLCTAIAGIGDGTLLLLLLGVERLLLALENRI